MKTIAILALCSALGGVAHAQDARDLARIEFGVPAVPRVVQLRYQSSLRELRAAELRQQRRDGGTLTAAHRAAFQHRLDHINEYYHREYRNTDPFSEDANGRAIDRTAVYAAEGRPAAPPPH